MSDAIFKLEHLKNYQIVEKPGSALVRVSSDVKCLIEGNHPRYLVNLSVIRKDDLDKIVKRVGNKTVNFDYVKDLFITGSIFKDNIKNSIELPIKGEKVIVTFNNVNGILRCTHISTIPRDNLKMVDLERLNLTQELFAEVMSDRNLLKTND
jgi:hypothetical protein